MPLLKRRIEYLCAGAVGNVVVRLLSASWRYQVDVPRNLLLGVRNRKRTAIFAFWHRHLLALLGCFMGYPMCVPVSEHSDGEYVAQVMERAGLLAVRGSTTHGRLRLIKGLLDAVERGRSCAITPDGPVGPCYSVQPGFVLLSRRTGLPVYPVGVNVESAWKLNSWDSFLIPRPFTRISVRTGVPIAADKLRDAPVATSCLELQKRLFEVNQNAGSTFSHNL